MSVRRRIAAALLPLLCACGGGGGDGDGDGDARTDASVQPDAASPAVDGSAPLAAAPVGRFDIQLVALEPAHDGAAEVPAHVLVHGLVNEHESPSAIALGVAREEGDCRLLEALAPFCDPSCPGSAVCIADGECLDYPDRLDLGTATLRGLRWEGGSGDLAMEPLPPNNDYQPSGSVHFEYPPFDEGAEIALETEGGALPPISLTTHGIAPLEAPAGAIAFARDAPAALIWTPPANPAASRIRVIVNITQHGGQKGEIDCETEDDGSLDVPQSLVEGLFDLGTGGFPGVQIIREASAATAIGDGEVALVTFSVLKRELAIPGLVSCMEAGAQDVCPDGQLCQDDETCR